MGNQIIQICINQTEYDNLFRNTEQKNCNEDVFLNIIKSKTNSLTQNRLPNGESKLRSQQIEIYLLNCSRILQCVKESQSKFQQQTVADANTDLHDV
ncbi:unnamed protein product (macronuclear) [Paramecium tetraurelia]|uniref:Uncharacterized protein n=1 Tax=Paramecium tetraurelia TaxID=5888 RepID=A0DS80_PARTE|nr:uncharacterized protein GSPATT00019601001 [Paramecium tetraurelia]CAK85897.1 unnamed protein product [Paramecium tetraurelia]|eukprot:XP_001453294.1 hypothetical protein (macronuclear) [Paramecium tetraurelia strain d4-2]